MLIRIASVPDCQIATLPDCHVASGQVGQRWPEDLRCKRGQMVPDVPEVPEVQVVSNKFSLALKELC